MLYAAAGAVRDGADGAGELVAAPVGSPYRSDSSAEVRRRQCLAWLAGSERAGPSVTVLRYVSHSRRTVLVTVSNHTTRVWPRVGGQRCRVQAVEPALDRGHVPSTVIGRQS